MQLQEKKVRRKRRDMITMRMITMSLIVMHFFPSLPKGHSQTMLTERHTYMVRKMSTIDGPPFVHVDMIFLDSSNIHKIVLFKLKTLLSIMLESDYCLEQLHFSC